MHVANSKFYRGYQPVLFFVVVVFFVCFFFGGGGGWGVVQHLGQQFFSHVGTEPPLPGYLPVLLGSLGVLLKEQ